jgi:hypothetical protein
MRDLKFACPHCDQHIQCEDNVAGQRMSCPACGKPVVVPALPDEHHLRLATGKVPIPAHAHGAPRATDMAAFHNQPPPKPQYSKLAIASLTLSCASVLWSFASVLVWPLGFTPGIICGYIGFIPGIVCGYMARAEIKRDGRILGDQLAGAGIKVGYGFMGLFALAVAVGIVLRIASK